MLGVWWVERHIRIRDRERAVFLGFADISSLIDMSPNLKRLFLNEMEEAVL